MEGCSVGAVAEVIATIIGALKCPVADSGHRNGLTEALRRIFGRPILVQVSRFETAPGDIEGEVIFLFHCGKEKANIERSKIEY
jgi:hypothetical protein